MIEEDTRNNPMLSPLGIKKSKGGVLKPSHHKLPLVDPTSEDLREEYGQLMACWLRAWYHMDQEEKNEESSSGYKLQ